MVAVDPPGKSGRKWRCQYCRAEGTLAALEAVECTHVYPPCKSCGQTPTCAPDCAAVWKTFTAPGVKVVT